MALTLEQLDTLVDDMRQAVLNEDWTALSVLDEQVKPCVEKLMAELAAGELAQSVVEERLQMLQAVCQDARAGADKARSEAREALQSMRQTSSAARAYQDISKRRS